VESVEKPRDLRYGSLLSLIDVLEGSEELVQLAAGVISYLGELTKQANPPEK